MKKGQKLLEEEKADPAEIKADIKSALEDMSRERSKSAEKLGQHKPIEHKAQHQEAGLHKGKTIGAS